MTTIQSEVGILTWMSMIQTFTQVEELLAGLLGTISDQETISSILQIYGISPTRLISCSVLLQDNAWLVTRRLNTPVS